MPAENARENVPQHANRKPKSAPQQAQNQFAGESFVPRNGMSYGQIMHLQRMIGNAAVQRLIQRALPLEKHLTRQINNSPIAVQRLKSQNLNLDTLFSDYGHNVYEKIGVDTSDLMNEDMNKLSIVEQRLLVAAKCIYDWNVQSVPSVAITLNDGKWQQRSILLSRLAEQIETLHKHFAKNGAKTNQDKDRFMIVHNLAARIRYAQNQFTTAGFQLAYQIAF